MKIEVLREFLIEANKKGYAAGEGEIEGRTVTTNLDDGSTTIQIIIGNHKLLDHYYGGEPYAGQEVVSEDKKTEWSMVYHGKVVEGVNADGVYSILRSALSNPDPVSPLRGPIGEYSVNGLVYRNQCKGDLSFFQGSEDIRRESSGEVIYDANYMGGWVDQRRE
jgi:hypothetical protein